MARPASCQPIPGQRENHCDARRQVGGKSDCSASSDEVRRPHRDKKSKTETGGSKAPSSSEALPATTFAADRSAALSRDDFVTAPARSVGPARVASNVRTTVVTDYSADVCKDYKQTGFCGFGDNCKFLHSREDYKQGWQLDREWESVTKGRQNLGGTTVAHADRRSRAVDENDEPADDSPLACAICGETCRLPVDPNCAVCGAATNGLFNSSKHLERKHEQKGDRSAE
ncbi:hypothetical protein QBC37DRAFT_436653 [Rhypophila decipiens]|uniref:Pre-mRNA-splicing factor CWC24 n=1 Tax=Rhypophila decipiens TaxID=261697 RepID=A0AAN6YJ24_9PEZI|nr:hypothetical protein QBC37DRAFT_436653 [Rhypophila decipiens]